jgi:hypothetical protein
MKIIDKIYHVVKSSEFIESFCLDVNKDIKELQEHGLGVEVHYQQSDCVVSALILGRREKGGDE